MNHFGSAEPFDAPQQKQHIAVNSSIATLLFAFKLYTFCLKKLQKKSILSTFKSPIFRWISFRIIE